MAPNKLRRVGFPYGERSAFSLHTEQRFYLGSINLRRHFDLPVSVVKQVTVFLRFPDPDAAIFIPFVVYSILRTIFPRTRPPSSAAKAWKAS